MTSNEHIRGGATPEEVGSIFLAQVQSVFTREQLLSGDVNEELLGPKIRDAIDEANERAAANPSNEPDRVITRIVEQYREGSRWSSKPLESLDQVLSRYKLTLKRLRDLDLAPYDETALLKAAAFAGLSRDTTKGLDVASRAMRILHHEATNLTSATAGHGNPLLTMARSVYAMRALDDLYAAEDADAFTIKSADEALRQWGSLNEPRTAEHPDEEPEPEQVPIEAVLENGRRVTFRRLLRAEAKSRLAGLHVIGNSLQDTLGTGAKVRYFEPVIFTNRDDIQTPEEDESTSRNAKTDNETAEDSTYLSGDYVIAEATYESNGQVVVHVVAESPNYGNACYALRGDVLTTLAETLGHNLTWRQVLGYPKVTARQLGARDFRHRMEGIVPQRVLDYLAEELNPSLSAIADKWFMGDKSIYGDDLRSTHFNRLPMTLTQVIEPRLSEIQETMTLWWTGIESARGRMGSVLGETATQDVEVVPPPASESPKSSDPVVEALQNRVEQLAVDNERLRLENIRLQARLELARRALSES